jgi:hypothetical protein
MPTRTGPWPGDRHEPAHALRYLVHPGARPVRAGLAEAGNAAVDDARIDLLHVLPRDMQPVFHGGAHVLDDDIGLLDQPHEGGVALGRFQVEPDRALVAVQVLEVEPVPRAADLLPAGVGRLDADDLGPPVGEMAHGGRPGAGQGEVEHRDARQRQMGLASELLLGALRVRRAVRHPDPLPSTPRYSACRAARSRVPLG